MNDSLNDEIDTLRSRVSDLEADILSLRIDLQRLEDRNQRMLDALCPFAILADQADKSEAAMASVGAGFEWPFSKLVEQCRAARKAMTD